MMKRESTISSSRRGFTACLAAALTSAHALLLAEPPHGSLLEVHSCEVYAGGCTVSSQATLEGRHVARGWSFTGGSFARSDFTGLRLAVLQTSTENLAARMPRASEVVVYLPQDATTTQRSALLAWVREQPEFRNANLQSRVTSLQFGRTSEGYRFEVGDFISIATAPLESCETQACGQALWYTPRLAGGVFTVALNQSSRVHEPLLKLNWADAGKRSVFLARLGTPERNRSLYVTTTDLCGPGSLLF